MCVNQKINSYSMSGIFSRCLCNGYRFKVSLGLSQVLSFFLNFFLVVGIKPRVLMHSIQMFYQRFFSSLSIPYIQKENKSLEILDRARVGVQLSGSVCLVCTMPWVPPHTQRIDILTFNAQILTLHMNSLKDYFLWTMTCTF